MATIRRRNPRSQRSRKGLIKYARDETSQGGEDGILEKIFELIPMHAESSDDCRVTRVARFCVDIGAWDGKHLSNTYNLLCNPESEGGTSEKWKGLLVEANTERFEELERLHRPFQNLCLRHCVSCLEDLGDEEETMAWSNSLPSILHREKKRILSCMYEEDVTSDLVPIIDFLCIDVDGTDYWLLKDALIMFSEGSIDIYVICCEFNPTMPDDLIYIQERSDSVRHGSSLSALCELANHYGFVLVETTLYNAFFVKKSLFHYLEHAVPIDDTSIEALHESSMCTNLYQLYDGTIKLSGCKRLLWHRLPIDEKKVQMLPDSDRIYPFAPPESCFSNMIVNLNAHFAEGSEVDKAQSRKKLLSHLRRDGFALINGTNMSPIVCKQALQATNMFFNEAPEAVRRSCLAKDRARRGYSPLNTENFANLVGDKAPNDLVKKFRIGSTTTCDQEASPLLSNNIWPDEKNWDQISASFFKDSVETYYSNICKISHTVVDIIREALQDCMGSKESLEALSIHSEAHSSILTLLGYTKGKRHNKQGKTYRPLVAPHTDVGVVTVLLFDQGDCARLQRCSPKTRIPSRQEADWVDVVLPSKNLSTPDDPIFVINIGDCLSEMSQNLLPSTLHRVQPMPGSVPRNCLALFVGLNPTTNLLLCDEQNNQIRITYEDWRKERIKRAMIGGRHKDPSIGKWKN